MSSVIAHLHRRDHVTDRRKPVVTSHLSRGQADLDVVLPMRRLTELAGECFVGRPAPRHYSIMGYILEPTVLVEDTAPAIAERMRGDSVDAAALVPA